MIEHFNYERVKLDVVIVFDFDFITVRYRIPDAGLTRCPGIDSKVLQPTSRRILWRFLLPFLQRIVRDP